MKGIWLAVKIAGALGALSLLLSACQQPDNPPAQGYIAGQYRYATVKFPARLKELYVQPNEHVTVGQPLFSLELQPQTAVVKQANDILKKAQWQLRHEQAQIALTKLALKHQQNEAVQQTISPNAANPTAVYYQTEQAQLAKTQQTITAAESRLAQASWLKTQKLALAQESALIVKTYYMPNDWLPAGRAVLSLLTPDDLEAIFFVSDQQLKQLALGQTVPIACNKCSSDLTAKIAFISSAAEYTPPMLDTVDSQKKLVYRIEAKFSSTAALALHPGQAITVPFD